MYIMIPNPSSDPVPRGGAGAQQFLLARRRGKFGGLRRATGSVVVGASAPGLGRCHLCAARQRGTDALATGSRWIRWIGEGKHGKHGHVKFGKDTDIWKTRNCGCWDGFAGVLFTNESLEEQFVFRRVFQCAFDPFDPFDPFDLEIFEAAFWTKNSKQWKFWAPLELYFSMLSWIFCYLMLLRHHWQVIAKLFVPISSPAAAHQHSSTFINYLESRTISSANSSRPQAQMLRRC